MTLTAKRRTVTWCAGLDTAAAAVGALVWAAPAKLGAATRAVAEPAIAAAATAVAVIQDRRRWEGAGVVISLMSMSVSLLAPATRGRGASRTPAGGEPHRDGRQHDARSVVAGHGEPADEKSGHAAGQAITRLALERFQRNRKVASRGAGGDTAKRRPHVVDPGPPAGTQDPSDLGQAAGDVR